MCEVIWYPVFAMKERWSIRKAASSDGPALEQCMHAAYQPYTDRIDARDLPPLNVDYAEEIRVAEVWIAESDNKVVGALLLATTGDEFSVANLAVHPRFQGNGLGRSLLDFAEKEALGRGYSEMCLSTHSKLSGNISLYRDLGWSEFARGDSHVRMKKPIADQPVSPEQTDAPRP